MIKIKTEKNHIEIIGHAMYDDFGKDIVCAAVSTLVISSINLALRFDEKSLKYDLQKDKLIIDVLKNDKITDTIISNMLEHLKELRDNYPKNIQITGEV